MNGLKQLAIEAGLFDEDGSVNGEYNYDEEVERFAKLVAAAEREACAKACEDAVGSASMYDSVETANYAYQIKNLCQKLIRARGNNAT